MKKSNIVGIITMSILVSSGIYCWFRYDYNPYSYSTPSQTESTDYSYTNIDTSTDNTDSVDNTIDNSVFDTSEQDNTVATLSDPALGMTEDEALNTTWGQPEDKTETKDVYETSALWIYSGGKSLFFVDGKLNSITQ